MKLTPQHHNIDGTLWTAKQLADHTGLTKSAINTRINKYKAGLITADDLFNSGKNAPRVMGIGGGIREISKNEWRSKKAGLLAGVLAIAAIMPLSTHAAECLTRVTITVDSQPAIDKKVRVRLYRLPYDGQDVTVQQRTGALNTFNLDCNARYLAKATLNGKTIRKSFNGVVPTLTINFGGQS